MISEEKPVWWLASYPKSGNTWVRMFLTAYRQHGRVDINSQGIVLGDVIPYFYQSVSPVPIWQMDTTQVMHIRPAALTAMLGMHNVRPLYVKTHNCFAELEDMPLIPKAMTRGATYIIRDPRDVAVSYSDHMGVSLDRAIEMMCDRLHSNGRYPLMHTVSRWDNHVKSWVDAAARHFKVGVVRYEDLLRDPQERFKKMLEHMEVPVSDHLVYYASGASSFESLRKQEAASGFKEKSENQERFFRQGKSGSWTRVLSRKQAQRIEDEFGSVMERFHYL